MIDTNVGVVANGMAGQADGACVEACIDALERVINQQRVLVDEGRQIFAEYQQNFAIRGQPGPGDRFFKWLWNNQANVEVCRQVPITEAPPDSFLEFPADPGLATFDRGDRKFVAVALASSETPPILNAVDTDWWLFRESLESNGVHIEFLCQHLMHG